MALKTVTGKATNPDGSVAAFAKVQITLSNQASITGTQEVVPSVINLKTAVDGTYSVQLQANNDMTPTGTYYTFVEDTGVSGGQASYSPVIVPQTAGPFIMSNLIGAIPALTPGPGHVSTLTVDGQANFTAGPVIIGTDPGGGQLLRVGGTAHFSGAVTLDSSLAVSQGASIGGDLTMGGAGGGNVLIPAGSKRFDTVGAGILNIGTGAASQITLGAAATPVLVPGGIFLNTNSQRASAQAALTTDGINVFVEGSGGIYLRPTQLSNAHALIYSAGFWETLGAGGSTQNILDDGSGRMTAAGGLKLGASADPGSVAAVWYDGTSVFLQASSGPVFLRPIGGTNNNALIGSAGAWVTKDGGGTTRNTLDDGSGNGTFKGNLTVNATGTPATLTLADATLTKQAFQGFALSSTLTVPGITISANGLTVTGAVAINQAGPSPGALSILSGASGSDATINIGRLVAESAISVIGSAGDYMIDSLAGDLVFRVPTGNTIRMGVSGGVVSILRLASAAIGFYGHAPVAQAATPVTLADVIAVIRGCGLAA